MYWRFLVDGMTVCCSDLSYEKLAFTDTTEEPDYDQGRAPSRNVRC
jgi:hypothetical protein